MSKSSAKPSPLKAPLTPKLVCFDVLMIICESAFALSTSPPSILAFKRLIIWLINPRVRPVSTISLLVISMSVSVSLKTKSALNLTLSISPEIAILLSVFWVRSTRALTPKPTNVNSFSLRLRLNFSRYLLMSKSRINAAISNALIFSSISLASKFLRSSSLSSSSLKTSRRLTLRQTSSALI